MLYRPLRRRYTRVSGRDESRRVWTLLDLAHLCGGWNGTVSLREVKALIAATHSPQKLCAASATKKSGTARRCACPSAEQWPATKFIVKRVSRASDDPGGVRAFLGAQVHKLTALHNSQPTP